MYAQQAWPVSEDAGSKNAVFSSWEFMPLTGLMYGGALYLNDKERADGNKIIVIPFK